METTIIFEKKVSMTPKEMNEMKTQRIDDMILKKAKTMVEKKCSENGFVVSGSVTLLSRSVGYYEAARFTGDVNYYVKLQGKVLYPVDGVRLTGKVIRKNKMGLYVNYKDAIHIQVPRDLHVGDPRYEEVEIGDNILLELKRSKFAINDPFILSSGQFITKEGNEDPQIEIDVIRNRFQNAVIEDNESNQSNTNRAATVAAVESSSDEEEEDEEEEEEEEEDEEAEVEAEEAEVEADADEVKDENTAPPSATVKSSLPK